MTKGPEPDIARKYRALREAVERLAEQFHRESTSVTAEDWDEGYAFASANAAGCLGVILGALGEDQGEGPNPNGWKRVEPGVWIHPDPIDADAARELMRQRLEERFP